MARGSCIVISSQPKGKFVEGTIGAGITTARPGIAMQIQPATALQGGRWTFELYNADADGGRPKGPIIILTEDRLQGRTVDTAYEAGERAFGYIPLPGDELNLILGDVGGTADDHVKGEILIIDDTTGEFIATTGTPEEEVAQLNESFTDPAADQLAWCTWQR